MKAKNILRFYVCQQCFGQVYDLIIQFKTDTKENGKINIIINFLRVILGNRQSNDPYFVLQ